MMKCDWRPAGPIENICYRAEVLRKTRDFFSQRGVMEVETPLLCSASVTDPHLHSLGCPLRIPGRGELRYYLQTSPEYAMKRLLAAGSGPIFQICKAFRDGERGNRHNVEFTILEWYRPGWDHHRLMDEIEEYLKAILHSVKGQRTSYRELFVEKLAVDPLQCSLEEIREVALGNGLPDIQALSVDTWLDLLMSHLLEGELGLEVPLFLYDYPASQAALSRIRDTSSLPVAERFEVYYQGVELANGYHELLDAEEHRRRFEENRRQRRALGLPVPDVDRFFLEALEHGLPPCAGVALGMDRLLMVMIGAKSIDEVLAFPVERA